LQVPTFTLWVEGMSVDSVIDVKPYGSIQSTFASLDVQTMRAAVNKEDPLHPPIFPPTIPDEDLANAASAVREVIAVIDPTFAASNVPLAAIDHTHPSRRYLHTRTRAAVASTRKRHERPLGRIRGKADHGLHLVLRPSLKVTRITGEQAAHLRRWAVDGFLGLDEAFGDLIQGIKDGFNTVYEVVLEPIADGINAAIVFIRDGVRYVWNGLVSTLWTTSPALPLLMLSFSPKVDYVEKAFDIISYVFETIGAFFKDLFAWLAFLLAWGDIENSANKFQSIILDFQSFGKVSLFVLSDVCGTERTC
jgi:hypothetical protein